MFMWNFHYMFRLVSCLFVSIVMVIGSYINQFCTINSLEYFNPPILLKSFLENSIHMQQVWLKNKMSNLISSNRNSKIIKLATLEYFILVYSWNRYNVFFGPYYVILINFNFKMPISWKLWHKMWFPWF